MKIIVRTLVALVAVVVIAAAAGAIWIASSPMPVVYLLRYGFGEDPGLMVPPDYAEHAARVCVERDLTYPSQDGKNTYDLYLPADAENTGEKAPVVVWLHGGAFVAGDKSGLENWGTMLASEGYAVAAVNYEWAPEISYPGQVRQAEECIAELKRAADAGAPIDMDRIVIAGDSAGAHIAAQAALLATNPAYEQAIGVSSELSADAVAGALLMCGPYNVAKIAEVDDDAIQFFVSRLGWALMGDKHWETGDMIATTTIKDYATADFPASFITDGNSGSFEREGKELATTLEALGVRTESLFFDIENGPVNHEYQMDLTSAEGWQAYELELAFLKDVLPVEEPAEEPAD